MLALVSFTTSAFLEPTAPVVRRAAGRAPAVVASAEGSTLSRRALVTTAAAAVPALLVQQASAEQTLVTRQQAYTRYVPRVERGRDYWSSAVKKQIQNQDWATLATAIEKKGSIDRIFGPMQLWASSFSGKTISEKTLAMNGAVDELQSAVKTLEIAAKGTEGSGGFLGFGGPKKIEESKRKELALKSYLKGVAAINQYIEIGNDGIGGQARVCTPAATSFAPLLTTSPSYPPCTVRGARHH